MMDFIRWLDWPAIEAVIVMLCGYFMGKSVERAEQLKGYRPSGKFLKTLDKGVGLLTEYLIR